MTTTQWSFTTTTSELTEVDAVDTDGGGDGSAEDTTTTELTTSEGKSFSKVYYEVLIISSCPPLLYVGLYVSSYHIVTSNSMRLTNS